LLNFACLAYLEVVFAATVTLLAAAYMALIRWRRPRQVARAWLLMVGGAALGAAVLCSQVIGYLGWEGFVEDVRLTFLARNTAAADLRAFRTEVWSFVEDHRLVFWDNFLGHIGINSTILRWLLLIYSPALVFLALLISAAWALSFLPALELVIHSRGSRRTWPAQSALPWATGAATLFVCAIFMDRSFAGFADGSRQMGSVGAALAVIVGAALGAVGLALHRRLRESAKDDFELPAIRLLLVAALLFCFAILARHHPDLYNGGERLAPLFRRVISRTGGTVVWQVAALAAATLAVGLLLAPRTLIGRERRGFRRLFLLLAAGVVAVVTVFHLFPGYVVTGYLQRYCPLTVYLHLVPFAAAFYVLARVVQAFGSAVLASRLVPPDSRSKVTPAAASSRHPLMHSTMSACALLLLGLLSFYWVSLQARLIGEFDPRAILFKELQKPQYAGASFVVNTYAAPIAFITKGWAYFDPQIGKSELRNPEPGKFYLRRDFRYLWLADKRLNKAYFEPDYFVCWIPRQLLYRGDTCRELQIVTEARNGTSLLRHREVARDPSGRDEWSIVRLSWTYPPGSGSKIEWHPRQYWRTLALPE
jgi:hypothetical protein